MTLSEKLVADWLAQEMCAEQLVQRDGESLIFHGERNTFLVELRVFDLGATTETRRLTEPVLDD